MELAVNYNVLGRVQDQMNPLQTLVFKVMSPAIALMVKYLFGRKNELSYRRRISAHDLRGEERERLGELEVTVSTRMAENS